jgi:hypothetical protein
MGDEKPLSLKRKACSAAAETDANLICIVHFSSCKDTEVVPLSESQVQTIREAAAKRQAQSNPDTRMDELCASLPVDFRQEIHGQHRWCYKKFTNVSRLQVAAIDNLATEGRSEASASVSEVRSSKRQQVSVSEKPCSLKISVCFVGS